MQDAGAAALPLTGPVLFIPDIAKQIETSDLILWTGNNYYYSGVGNQFGDYTNPQMWVDMARIVAAAAGNRVLILPILPAADEPADGTPNPNVPGDAYHLRSARAAANARTEALFPTAIARDAAGRTLLKRLQDSGNGSANDNADVAAGLTPRSLRTDALHLNAAGDAVVYAFVKEALARQTLPSPITQNTVFTLTATGTNPRTGADVRETAYAVVRRGVVADLAQAIDGALTSSAYYPTLAEAISDLGVGEYFNSDDQASTGLYPGVKWIYKRIAVAPFYEAVRRWGDKADVGLGAYPDSPDELPVSGEQADAIAASTGALAQLTGYALDKRPRVDSPQVFSAGEKQQARTNIGAIAPGSSADAIAGVRADVGMTPASALDQLRARVRPSILPQSGDLTTDLAAATADARAGKAQLFVAPGRAEVSAVVDARSSADDFGGLAGAGAARTVIESVVGGHAIVRAGGRYARNGGFSAGFSTLRPPTENEAVSIQLNDAVTFGALMDALAYNGVYGIGWDGAGGHANEFNMLYATLRAMNNYAANFQFSQGSGSVALNLYASNIARSGVLHMFVSSNFSGEHIRLNLERTTCRSNVIHLTVAHDVSFYGLHSEEISLIGRGYTPLRAETLTPAMIYTTGQGHQAARQWTLDSCHYGPIMVRRDGVTVSGTSATIRLEHYGFQQKTLGGCGIEVGDSVTVDGAADAGLNGVHAVQAVNPEGLTPEMLIAGVITAAQLYNARNTIVIAVPGGLPASPQPADGADCITVNLGETYLSAVSLVHMGGNAGEVLIEGLHIRDCLRGGATPAQRRQMLRVMAAAAVCPGRVRLRGLSAGPQRSPHARWRGRARIAGYKRVAGVATVYFARPHDLRGDTVLNIYGAADASFNGRAVGGLTAVSPYAVSFASAGADKALTRDGGTLAIAETVQLAQVARAGKYATLTTAAEHGYIVGNEIAIRASDATYNADNAVVIEVPSATTLLVRNIAADSTAATDTGSLMLIEAGLSTDTLLDTSFAGSGGVMGGIVELPYELDHYCTIFAPGTIAAGATATNTDNVQFVTPGRDRVQVKSIEGADGRLRFGAEVAAANQVAIRASNPNPPTLPWAASTTYAVGQRRANNGNVYVCITAGTSAASGGPTGTGQVNDNTCRWAYEGSDGAISATGVIVHYRIVRD